MPDFALSRHSFSLATFPELHLSLPFDERVTPPADGHIADINGEQVKGKDSSGLTQRLVEARGGGGYRSERAGGCCVHYM